MPEIKNTFVQGKMNQDLDERIVPNGQYIDAMNIKVTSSDDASVGVVQNILGNHRVEDVVPPSSGYTCIATITDEKTNRLYWFVTRRKPTIHAILEYDITSKKTKFVLIDRKNDTLKFTENVITGVNIIDNLLFWTDNNSEPKKINIDNCKQGTDQTAANLDNTSHTQLVVGGVEKGDISEKNITVIKKSPKQPPLITIKKPTDEYKPKLFEQVFPRFSFRYRYEDGEYSSFGPFTQVVFNPVYVSGESGYDRENAYSTKDSHNLAMINYIESIEIYNFISSSTPEDVTQVEILYKEDGSPTVYSIKTIDHDGIEWVNNAYVLKSESIFAAIPSNQFLRPWDNVPKKALAQEITGNRIVYANYTQGYDLLNWEKIKVGNSINASFGLRENNSTFDEGGLPSLKTQRNYQVGFVWGDKYGRETPVFTSENGGVNIPWYDNTLDKLLASESLFLKTTLSTAIPFWADYYKVYVKETSGDYYNMLMEKAYPQSNLNVFDFEEDRIWLAFPSADRNKVTEDDYLIIKKQLIGDHSQIPLENKFKILDIQNEAPDAIKFEYTSLGKANQTSDASTSFLDDDLFSSADFRIDNTAIENGVRGVDMIYIKKDEWLNTLGGASLSPDNDNDNLHVKDLYIYWLSDGVESERYKVIGINVLSGSYRLKLQKHIEKYDAELAFDSTTSSLKSDLQFFIDRKDEKDTDEFSGKFFVQIVYKPPTMPEEDLGINSPRQITNQIQSNWLYDVIATDSIDANGIINVGTDSAPPDETTLQVNALSPTNTEALWDSLATAMTDNGGSGFFIDNMYMVAGQPSDTFSAKLSGKTWTGWAEGAADPTPTWGVIDTGGYGWRSLGLSEITSSYSPRPFSYSGSNKVLDVTYAMNGLEGFLTTEGQHTGNTIGNLGPIDGYRRWRKNFTTQFPLSGHGDNTYGAAELNGPNGAELNGPNGIGGFQPNISGRHFIHLSFLAPGVDLHNGDWTLNPWLTGDENLKGVDSPGSHMQAIWGGGIFTGNGKVLEMEGNYDASDNPLADAPGPGVGQGYDLGLANIYKIKHDNQWDPAYGGTTEENDKIQEFIDNIVDGAEFHFSSDTNKTRFRIIGDKKIKRIYNHTPWIAQYKWDESTPSPTANSGLILCGNSVDEAASAWLDNTAIDTTFTDLQDKITEFGKANNRRVVYIFEVDKNPLDVDDVKTLLTGADNFDSNSPLDIVFTSSSPNVLLKDLIKGTAIWETEAKPGEELDLYYEASQAIPIYLTDETNELFAPVGSRIEILLDEARNGEFIIGGDILLESWNSNKEITLSGDGFNKRDSGGSDIVYVDAQIRFFRPDGGYTTTKIVSVDDSLADYVKDITLDTILDSSMEQGLSYFNCYSFGNGIESNRIRDDFNAPSISKGVKASLVLDQEYKEENRKNGLIYSGIYNSTSGVNNLNQFIMAEKITKDLNPTYGSIQKLFQRRISLVAFCEDRTISITSNKDALFNADGNSQLVSTNNVLGDATPFVGDFGISQNPESFAKESYRAYFTDKQRGAVLRLSMDGITPISNAGMDDYFRDNLKLSGEIIGSYDSHSKNYNVTLRESKPGQNIVANSFINLGGSSILNTDLIPQEIIINGDISGYDTLQLAIPDPVDNEYRNDLINVETTITNYDKIPAGSLIPETSTTVTTTTNTTFNTTSSGVFYSFSVNSPNNPFTGDGQDNYTAATHPLSGGFDDNMDSHLYPAYTSIFGSSGTQQSDSGKFWSGIDVPPNLYNHGPSENIFWQQEADDYTDGTFTINLPNGVFTYSNSNAGWQLGVPSADEPWFYAGSGVTAGYRGFIFDGAYEGGSNMQPTLTLPGNRDADGNPNDDLLLGQVPIEYPDARNNTIFNGEEIKITFFFKHDPNLNTDGTTTYAGPNGNTPRRVTILLYDGIIGEGGTPVSPDNILDTANLPTGVTSSEYASYSQTPSTSAYERGYQTNRYVNFPEIANTNNTEHVAYFKFTNEDEDEGICINDLQISFRVYNGNDSTTGGRIFGHTYGNLGSVNIEKVFRLEEANSSNLVTTYHGNAMPSADIPAFATVMHTVSNWELSDDTGALYEHVYTKEAKILYGFNFGLLTTTTLTQLDPNNNPTGNTATYVFPTSSNVSNGTVFYNDYPNASTFGGTTNSAGGVSQSGGVVRVKTTDDVFQFDNETNSIVIYQNVSVTQNDWYFADLIYNSYTPGSEITIKSIGDSNGVLFKTVSTSIYGSEIDVLRAIFQIDSEQSANSSIEVLIPNDVEIEIEEFKLIEINDTYTGGDITSWNFNNDPNPPNHSLDTPSIYGSDQGIQFEVASGNSKRYVYQNFITPLTPTLDGYKLEFEISNYVSGSLDMYTIGEDAEEISEGITVEDIINANGNYSIDFNFDDNSYDLINNSTVVGTTTPVSQHATAMTNLVIFKSDSINGFIGCVKNISLIDQTNYFTGATIGEFNISGFDQIFYEYIDFQDNDGNGNGEVLFNDSPILGSTGEQIQISQLIEKQIEQNETYRLSFDYNITSGSIGVYYFSSYDNVGFKRINISGNDTFDELITINEAHTGNDLVNSLVFFVNEDNTTGTIDNILLRQEFLQTETSTLSFNENAKGWVSKKSFIPEQGISVSSEYFTIDKGRLYEHNKELIVNEIDTNRNTFYGVYEPSTITAVLNQSPSSVKIFNTLNYEGSQSNVTAGDAAVSVGGNTYSTMQTYNLTEEDGWSVDYIKTDKQEGSLNEFIEKEGKWFNYIKGLSTDIKTSDLSFQGLGIVKTIN